MSTCLLVRPKPKLAESVEYFKNQRINAVGIAPLDIQSVESETEALRAFFERSKKSETNSAYLIIVTSTEAAKRLASLLNDVHIRPTKILCVGESSASILNANCDNCVVPNEQTSEGIIAYLNNQLHSTTHFVIVKGKGGRDVLENNLREKNTVLSVFNVYERVGLIPPLIVGNIDWTHIDTIIATSGSLMEQLLSIHPEHKLTSRLWIVPSQRLVAYGKQLGCKEIVCSHGATDRHLLGCIMELQRGQT